MLRTLLCGNSIIGSISITVYTTLFIYLVSILFTLSYMFRLTRGRLQAIKWYKNMNSV
jgi:hypothetical protein